MNDICIINKESYVAFLDILGFKDIVNSKQSSEILKIFESIQKKEKSIGEDTIWDINKKYEEEYNELSKQLLVYIMSDSIILAIPCDVKHGLDFLMKWCSIIQSYLLIKHEITLRGGISSGIFYREECIMFGKGLVSAVELENNAKYPRIIIDESIKYTPCCLPFLKVNIQTDENDKIRYLDYFSLINWNDDNYSNINRLVQKNLMKAKSIKEKYEWIEKIIKDKKEEYDIHINDLKCEEEIKSEIN